MGDSRIVKDTSGLVPYDSRRAIQANAIRWEKTRGAAAVGLIKAVREVTGQDITSAAAAFGVLVERQVKILLESKTADIPALERIQKLISGGNGSGDNSQRADGGRGPSGGAILTSPETLMRIVELIERDRRQDAVIVDIPSDE